MPCVVVKLPNGGVAICKVAAAPRKRCRWCDLTCVALCDFPISSPQQVTHRKTCNAPMCEIHQTRVGPDRDYCPDHKGKTP